MCPGSHQPTRPLLPLQKPARLPKGLPKATPSGACPSGACPSGACPLVPALWCLPTGACPKSPVLLRLTIQVLDDFEDICKDNNMVIISIPTLLDPGLAPEVT